ncbi:hypothetical protein ILUMI_00253 [Ignelater luminosus]|uniref:Uncharacterized protein n=1 Tax=Ignelater luminosus TaxID=2038154 RepID=A0A8K0GMT6_IGNLU|nr:hypothetical protein ILUMI_00253 [Ignelater luminosus]
MAVDQFCLKWNNFQSSIVTAFGSLQSTEDLADVTLTCEGISIKAHKIILSACSPYFRAVFKENPCPHPIVILKDVLHSDLLAVLNFMYHGEVLIAQDKLVSFLQTAEALQVSGLVATAALQDLPVKLTPNPTKLCSKPAKLCKIAEVSENAQKRVKVTSKPKVIKSQSPVIAKTPENSLALSAKLPESPTIPKGSESSTPSPKQRDSPLLERFETVTVDSIKTELLEESHGDHNFNDKIDMYDLNEKTKLQSSSILEAALEVKDSQPSILERSLTSHTSKSPSLITYALDNVTVIQQSSPEPEHLYVPKKPDHLEGEKRLKHKLPESTQQIPGKAFDFATESPQQKNIRLDEECMKNMEVNIQGLPSDISVLNVKAIQDVQPHHSSQCGNCPHCGKIYSNQSALKYHVRLVHSDLTNMYCCHLCPESFDYREGYKKHMVEVHSIRN